MNEKMCSHDPKVLKTHDKCMYSTPCLGNFKKIKYARAPA